MILLPPSPHVCQSCAVEHSPDQPHNQQSIYWQYWFYSQYGRRPTWADAMAHCDAQVQSFWIEELKKRGVDVQNSK